MCKEQNINEQKCKIQLNSTELEVQNTKINMKYPSKHVRQLWDAKVTRDTLRSSICERYKLPLSLEKKTKTVEELKRKLLTTCCCAFQNSGLPSIEMPTVSSMACALRWDTSPAHTKRLVSAVCGLVNRSDYTWEASNCVKPNKSISILYLSANSKYLFFMFAFILPLSFPGIKYGSH